MWWSKTKLTESEMERSYVLEERTRILKQRIADMNKLIDRDELDRKVLAKLVLEQTEKPQTVQEQNSQREDELARIKAKLLGKKI